MSQIINELATIEVSNEVVQELDLAGIYRSFSENYKKLGDLKNFRSSYEKHNRAMRWWHNDKLRDAQLDSAEVQGEFSKTIGQLMMISIMQSRKLTEQQALLNEQQHKLARQADGIAENAATLQGQHRKLAEQSIELKTLVEDYIALKGLTEDGMQKLVAIAKEIKATKESMVLHVDQRTQAIEAQCSDVAAQMQALSVALEEKTIACTTALRQNEATQQSTNTKLQSGLSELATQLEQRHGEHDIALSEYAAQLEQQAAEHAAHRTALASQTQQIADGLSASSIELTACAQQQQAVQQSVEGLRRSLSIHIKRSIYVAAGLSVVAIAGLLAPWA